MTKKNYIAPSVEEIAMVSGSEILAGSTLDPNGGLNSDIMPGNDPNNSYNGDFRSNTNNNWTLWK